ncbi:PilX N-terminal domain-containing pilus assembly protein [Macromonas nakdongensis]|uniref:PilX N-terminal domain-containing pilus assembly protein n=1 Tax=Macromonas nakdongensis TaxID=1843082 RepID=UPI0012FF185E|nr:PilX N-terminal domain-containing pilus assembly protein [Macromonas nakdongensis]
MHKTLSLTHLPGKQRGVATVFISIVFLTLLTLVTLYSSRFLIFEQNISTNQYRSTQAFEAAQLGLERGVAWLQSRSSSPNIENWSGSNTTTCKENTTPTNVYSIYSLAWSAPAGNSRFINASSPCNLNMPTSLAIQMGSINYTVNIQYTQTISTISDIAFLKISATSASSDTMGGSARVEQVVSIPAGPTGSGGLADSPLIVKQCLTGVTGNPDICPANVSSGSEDISGAGGAPDCATGTGTTGVALVSLQPTPTDSAAAESCLPLGSSHMKPHGGGRSFLNTPTATVWDTLFPNGKLTEQMVQTFAAASVPGFVYYNGSNAPAKIPAQGTSSQPVIIYVDSSADCLKLAPGDFHALVYYETTSNCELHGGGSVDLTGTIAAEGSITKFNANTIIRNSAFTNDWESIVTEGAAIFARVPGTWRDFQ